MKVETKGIPVMQFGGLKAKMYTFIKENDKERKKAKAINKDSVKKLIIKNI